MHRSMGFVENGQRCDDEIVAVLPVKEAQSRFGTLKV